MCREESKMAKPLWEFVEKRMRELGMTRYDLETEHDIAYATVQRLKAGSTNIKDSTKQKLALALQCTIGDINAAISGQVSTEKPEELPDITDKPKEPPDVIPRIEIAGKIVNNPPCSSCNAHKRTGGQKAGTAESKKTDPLQKKERQKERWPEDPPEEKKTPPPDYVDAAIYSATQPPDVFGIKRARREAVAEYKQKLKDICIAAYLDVPKLNITGETATGYIGRALMKELLKDDTEAE